MAKCDPGELFSGDGLPAPWDDDTEPAGRTRRDAFTPARRRVFLKHLGKTGCIADAARLTGVSPRTVYRHQDADPAFARYVDVAIAMAGGGIEQIAWERAVTGITEQFACGGKVHTRQRYSDGLLRLLLQATNPDKYGARPGFSRKRMRKWERDEIERDVRRKLAARETPRDEVAAKILRKIENLRRDDDAEYRAAGWTQTEDEHWIPPGWIRDPSWVPPQEEAWDEEASDEQAFEEDASDEDALGEYPLDLNPLDVDALQRDARHKATPHMKPIDGHVLNETRLLENRTQESRREGPEEPFDGPTPLDSVRHS